MSSISRVLQGFTRLDIQKELETRWKDLKVKVEHGETAAKLKSTEILDM